MTSPSADTPMSPRPYRICSNCIMDTSDAGITFDARGWCDYCNNFHTNILPNWHTDERGQAEIDRMVAKIRKDGEGREYDSLLGISGGVDSSYLAYLAKEKFGLRPLIFHVDAGWNSQQAVHNIERIVDGLGLHLHTEVINWQEMKDLQLAFFARVSPERTARGAAAGGRWGVQDPSGVARICSQSSRPGRSEGTQSPLASGTHRRPMLTSTGPGPISMKMALVGHIDVFTIWTVVLLIFGFAALSKTSRGRAAGMLPISTVAEPREIMPGPPGTQPGSVHGVALRHQARRYDAARAGSRAGP